MHTQSPIYINFFNKISKMYDFRLNIGLKTFPVNVSVSLVHLYTNIIHIFQSIYECYDTYVTGEKKKQKIFKVIRFWKPRF